jgi:hypothetical protein
LLLTWAATMSAVSVSSVSSAFSVPFIEASPRARVRDGVGWPYDFLTRI